VPIDDPKVVAAVIAGLVAAGGVLASVLSSRCQLKLKAEELSLASEGHKHQLERLNQEIEALKKNQLTEILKKGLKPTRGFGKQQ